MIYDVDEVDDVGGLLLQSLTLAGYPCRYEPTAEFSTLKGGDTRSSFWHQKTRRPTINQRRIRD